MTIIELEAHRGTMTTPQDPVSRRPRAKISTSGRPNAAPAYSLERSAGPWIALMRPRRRQCKRSPASTSGTCAGQHGDTARLSPAATAR
jgi:hypothetical protein